MAAQQGGGGGRSSSSSSWLMNAYVTFHKKHERLKNYVHNGFRYPLPPWGRTLMGFVYFSLPVLGGYHVMQWAISKSHEEIGIRGTLNVKAKSWGNTKTNMRTNCFPYANDFIRSFCCVAHCPPCTLCFGTRHFIYDIDHQGKSYKRNKLKDLVTK